MLMTLGRPGEAAAIFRELLPLFEELGDVQYQAVTISSLGWSAYAQGDAMGAARWIIRGLIESHRMRDAATTTIGMQEGIVIARALDRPDVAALLTEPSRACANATACDRPLHFSISCRDKTHSRPHTLRWATRTSRWRSPAAAG